MSLCSTAYPCQASFFQGPVLQSKLCHQLLELLHVTPELFDFIAAGLPLGVPCQSLFTRLQEFLAPFVVEVLVDAFSPAELCDSVFPSQSFDYDPDLLLC